MVFHNWKRQKYLISFLCLKVFDISSIIYGFCIALISIRKQRKMFIYGHSFVCVCVCVFLHIMLSFSLYTWSDGRLCFFFYGVFPFTCSIRMIMAYPFYSPCIADENQFQTYNREIDWLQSCFFARKIANIASIFFRMKSSLSQN